MESVYVVFTYRDYRKENGANILGVYRQETTARLKLIQFVEEDVKKYGGEIKTGGNGFTVVRPGPDYQVYAITKKEIIDE